MAAELFNGILKNVLKNAKKTYRKNVFQKTD